jgi:hypothetical protein
MQRKRALHQGWFIGSGVVEAGCKNVVGKRLKQSGMFWSEPGATCVLNFHTLLAEQPIRLLLEKTATTPTSPKMMRSPWSLSHSREQFCRAPTAPKL